MSDYLEQELIRLNQVDEARDRLRVKMTLLLEHIPKGIKEAESGNAEAAAVYLSATQKILTAAMAEEEYAYNRLMGQKAHAPEKQEKTP